MLVHNSGDDVTTARDDLDNVTVCKNYLFVRDLWFQHCLEWFGTATVLSMGDSTGDMGRDG